MIRIHKRAAPLPVLATRGREETAAHRVAYDSNPAAYDSGTAQLSFDSSLYGHDSVKRELIAAQHGKCCFCEAKITHISYGDVEHFRPKAGYRQHPDDPLGRPGYYWLAYEWPNLYLSCQMCNQRFKRNTFPLRDAGLRCRNHRMDLAQEEPLFLDPGAVDPEDHIEFAAEQPIAKNGSPRGLATIEALGLRREPLRERRFDRYKILTTLQEVARLLPEDPLGRKALSILSEAQLDGAEYASMARSALRRS
jgi:uncharacterized protein (TIGR02646 family)